MVKDRTGAVRQARHRQKKKGTLEELPAYYTPDAISGILSIEEYKRDQYVSSREALTDEWKRMQISEKEYKRKRNYLTVAISRKNDRINFLTAELKKRMNVE